MTDRARARSTQVTRARAIRKDAGNNVPEEGDLHMKRQFAAFAASLLATAAFAQAQPEPASGEPPVEESEAPEDQNTREVTPPEPLPRPQGENADGATPQAAPPAAPIEAADESDWDVNNPQGAQLTQVPTSWASTSCQG